MIPTLRRSTIALLASSLLLTIARGGDLRCQWQGERVLIGGQAVTYLIGKIALRQVNA